MISVQLSPIERFAALVASCCVAATALLLCLAVTFAPTYSDFIVGNVTWDAKTKFQDMLAVPVFIVSMLGSLYLFSRQIRRYKVKLGDEGAAALTSQMLWWAVPAIVTVGAGLSDLPTEQAIFGISGIGMIYLLLVLFLLGNKGREVSPTMLGLGMLSVLLIALLPFEAALLTGRLPAGWLPSFELSRYVKASLALAVMGFFSLIVVIGVSADRFSRILPRLLLIGQLGLPTFFACFYPARLMTPDGTLTTYSTTPSLKILLAALMLWGVLDVVYRYLRFVRSAQKTLTDLISPLAFFALLMALKAGTTIAPHISPDDYHFGEHLLGWWSYLHGVIPYIGYMPAHGIIGDDLPGMLSYFFYDGKASSVVEASRLATLILALPAFFAIHRYSSSVGLAFISVFFLGGFSQSTNLNWLFLTPFICIWLSPKLMDKPAQWLTVWVLTAPVAILGVPPQGLLLVAASGLAALYVAWRYMKAGPIWHGWKEFGVAVLILLILGLLSPFMSMMMNAVRYVLENGPINQVAYGIPWKLSWSGGGRSGLTFELIRMSWLAVPLLCIALLYKQRNNLAFDRTQFIPAVVILAFSLLLIPYSMGRIDPGAGSRPGSVGILSWAILLPVAAWGLLVQRDKAAFALLIAGISATLNISSPSLLGLIPKLSGHIPVAVLRDGASIGLPHLGAGVIQDEQWDRLTQLNALLSRKLSPGESYLDLTSRNAQYFYLDRLPKQVVTAPYNMVPPSQQKRAIESLQKDLPNVALLEGNNITHDGGGLALRTPYLYRFIVDHYSPRLEDGFIIGYKKTSEDRIANPMLDVAVKNITDTMWDRGVHRQEMALVLTDSALLPFLSVGDQVYFTTGETRKINRISTEGNSIWLNGPSVDPALAGHPNRIRIAVAPQIEVDYQASLLERAFAQSDLRKIPVAWGRSEASLIKKMTLVKELDGASVLLHQLIHEDDKYKVIGADPHITFNISDSNLSGRNAGLLRFEFSCVRQRAKPRMQVFWWGDDHEAPFEASSIKFTAEEGRLIVPLDASPRWLLMKRIKGLRIDLDNSLACEAFNIKGVRLYQKNSAQN